MTTPATSPDRRPSTHDPRVPFALAYLAAGRAVFVLGRSRRPLPNCYPCRAAAHHDGGHDPAACACLTCHGFYAATHDPDRARAALRAVPSGLLAVATGAVSDLVVIDVDPRNGGRIDPDLMPPTYAVATARGGWHLYYAYPHDPDGAARGGPRWVRSRPLPGVPGVDVKADGGYVVAPPTVLPAGGTYRQVTAGGQRPVEMPPPLLARCLADAPGSALAPTPHDRGHRAPSGGPYGARGAGGITSPEALLTALLDTVRRAAEGNRRATLYGSARGVARMVSAGALDPARAWADLWDVGRAAGQTSRETRAAILGAFRDEGVPLNPPADGVRGAA